MSVPLPYAEWGILSRQRIECLLYTEKRVSLLFLYTEERVCSLHGEESVLLLFAEVADSWRDSRGIRNIRNIRVEFVFSAHRRECPSAICRGGHTLYTENIECLLYTEERVSLLLLCTDERVSSLHGEESVLLLFVEVAGS